MKAVLVANPKGGSGKTTLATNLAGALALQEVPGVMLWDLDRQHSAREWLAMRPSDRPIIRRLDGKAKETQKGGQDSSWLILDAPAGIHGKNLGRALRLVHKVIVPVQPSIFDMAATSMFIQELMSEKAMRKQKTFVGIVGMRVDPRTKAASTLEAFLDQFDLPILSYLRDTQVYANAAFNGLSIFDLPASVSGRDVEQWQPILEWLLEE